MKRSKYDTSRVAVCGGRTYTNLGHVAHVLDELMPISFIMSGGAPGADLCAHVFALARCIPHAAFDAPWMHGNFAGPLRNGWVIEHGQPTLLVAFPGERGTSDMMDKARTAGVPVIDVSPEWREDIRNLPDEIEATTYKIDDHLREAYERLTGSRRYRRKN